MGRGARDLNTNGSDDVVPLGVEPPAEPPKPSVPTSGLHRAAVVMMSLCAAIALVAFVGFLTVGWPGVSRRIVIAVGLFAVIGFLASAAIAVLGAARDTYATRRPK